MCIYTHTHTYYIYTYINADTHVIAINYYYYYILLPVRRTSRARRMRAHLRNKRKNPERHIFASSLKPATRKDRTRVRSVFACGRRRTCEIIVNENVGCLSLLLRARARHRVWTRNMFLYVLIGLSSVEGKRQTRGGKGEDIENYRRKY